MLSMLLGGVLADRYDRKLILFARTVCGVSSSAWPSTPGCRRVAVGSVRAVGVGRLFRRALARPR